MPAIDHDERRHKIAAIAAEVIAREGFNAATIRRIAAAAGFSTTIVTHYFADKDEVLMCAYRFVAEQANERLDRILARDPADLPGSLMSMIPLETGSEQGWRVYVAFWQKAGIDSDFAREQRLWIDHMLDRVTDLLRPRCGDRPGLRESAQRLIALVQGISLQLLFDNRSWTEAGIREVLDEEIRRLPTRDVGSG